MKRAMFSTKVGVVVVLMLGLAASPRLPADWGFAETWDIAKNIGVLEQSDDWGISLFEMAGEYPACALGVDDDCDGAVDGGFFLGEKEKAEVLLSQLPTEEIALNLGGVLTKKGWSGITIIDPETWQDMILLSYGDPPAGMTVNAPIVMDISEPVILDKASPVLYKALGFLIAISQHCIVKYEWDFDYDGIPDKVGYWGNKKPVFLGPGIPGAGQDTLWVVDNNVPAKTTTYYVGGNPPETLGRKKIIIQNSNMGFKLNLVAVESPGEPGLFSNMGFKLNYTLWQGADDDPSTDTWSGGHCSNGICSALASSSWALMKPPDSATKKIVGIHLGSAVAAFDGELSVESEIVVSAGDPIPIEEVTLRYTGGGRMALLWAGEGWTTHGDYKMEDVIVAGFGPAAVLVMEGEGWSMEIMKKKKAEEKGRAGGGAEDDIVFLYPEYNPLTAARGAYSTVNCGQGEEEMAWEWDPMTNTWLSLLVDTKDSEGIFVRGEVNLDSLGTPDISDAIFILQWLFCGGKEPLCLDAADVNDDGTADISDGIALLSFLFSGGRQPREPFPGAGSDLTADSLDCDLLR
jgi:hypothetical protein